MSNTPGSRDGLVAKIRPLGLVALQVNSGGVTRVDLLSVSDNGSRTGSTSEQVGAFEGADAKVSHLELFI